MSEVSFYAVRNDSLFCTIYDARMLHLSHVSKTYGHGAARVSALHDVSLQVSEGEFVAVMGSSGAGKSTLLHLMGGLDQPSEGQVEARYRCQADSVQVHFLSKNIGAMNDAELSRFRHEHVGFVFQDALLLPQLTAEENVVLVGMFGGKFGADIDLQIQATQLLKEVGLEHRLHHKPHELSGGEKQRVCIARALMMNPELILADEPTGNLDEKTGREILKLFQKFQAQRKTTLVIATHDKAIAHMAHRVIGITGGSVA